MQLTIRIPQLQVTCPSMIHGYCHELGTVGSPTCDEPLRNGVITSQRVRRVTY